MFLYEVKYEKTFNTRAETMIGTGENVDWSELEAITFDVDANLYNYPRMMIPRLPRWGIYLFWLMKLTKVRQIIRREGIQENFRKRQAEIMSEEYGLSFERCDQMINKVLYDGWNEDFKGVKPYKGTHEFVQKVVDNGIKIAVVTDYPPHKKLEYMGFMDYPWAVIIEAEEIGELKPSKTPFIAALKDLGLEDHPERVMHIGDSYNYDVKGAQAVGMKTAWLRRKWRFSKLPWGEEDKSKITPDIIFKSWREFTGEMTRLCGWK